MERASCHPSGGPNFEMASRFFENLWVSLLKRKRPNKVKNKYGNKLKVSERKKQ
jgi:hypothetical protein